MTALLKTIAGITAGVFIGGVMFALGNDHAAPPVSAVKESAPAPAVTITAPPLPQATKILPPKVVEVTKTLPQATKTITRRVEVEVTKTLPRATVTVTKKVASSKKRPPAEDEAGFDCRSQGNRICGPDGSRFTPGCYREGRLIIPWTNFKNPQDDPLYGQVTSPC